MDREKIMSRSVRIRNNNKPASILIRSDKFTATASNDQQKEVLDDLVRRENDFLEQVRDFAKRAEVLKSNQATVLTGRKKIEDRMIGILSFATSIELYRRFLEERSMNATQQLAEQIDDLALFQQFVEMTEKSVEKCNEMIGTDLNNEIEAENFEEELELEALEAENTTRRMILEIKKQIARKPSTISKQKPLIIKRPPQSASFSAEEQFLYDQLDINKSQELVDKNKQSQQKTNQDKLEVLEILLAQLEIKYIQEVVDKAKKSQQKLNQEHFALEQYESDFSNRVQALAERYNMKKEKMKSLRKKLSDNEKIRLNINELNEENARLRTTLCGTTDGSSDERRFRAYFLKVQERYDLDKVDIISYQARCDDRYKYAKKRRHEYKKRLEQKKNLEEEIQKLDEECLNKINEVIEIERQEHEMEVALNKKLKEMQNILIQNDEEASFESSCVPPSQVEELQKIISLVSNNENTNLN